MKHVTNVFFLIIKLIGIFLSGDLSSTACYKCIVSHNQINRHLSGDLSSMACYRYDMNWLTKMTIGLVTT